MKEFGMIKLLPNLDRDNKYLNKALLFFTNKSAIGFDYYKKGANISLPLFCNNYFGVAQQLGKVNILNVCSFFV